MQLSKPFKKKVNEWQPLPRLVVVTRGILYTSCARVALLMTTENGKNQLLELSVPEAKALIVALGASLEASLTMTTIMPQEEEDTL